MRKSSSHNPRDNKRGPGNFRKDSGKPRNAGGSFRKNDDRGGRPAGDGSSARPFRSKPGGGKPFGKREEGAREDRPFTPRGDKRNFSSDRPERKWSDRPGKPERDNKKFGDDKRGDRPFRDRPKPAGDKWRPERADGEQGGRPERDERKFGNDSRGNKRPADSRPFRDRPKPANKWRTERPEGEAPDKPERSERKFDEDKRGSRPAADSRPFRDRPKPANKWKPDRGEGKPERVNRKFGDDSRGNRPPADSRPFRDRPKPATDKKKPGKPVAESATQEAKEPSFKDVVKQAFNGSDEGPKNMDHATREQFEDKVYGELGEVTSTVKKPYELKKNKDKAIAPKVTSSPKSSKKKKYREDDEDEEIKTGSDEMTLNKFIAHSGECSRREAAELVKQGKVKVNGELVMDPGYRVKSGDSVTMSGKKLTPQKELVYLLLNKPKGYITTNDDPQGRRTVMDLVTDPGVDRVFPVGRLDRDTTGLLLLTNDGELTQKLSHPSYNVKKVYHVTLDKPLTKADFDKIMEGVELEDGKAVVDEMAYLEAKNELGLEIHSGKNRIVRRIFESQGYVVDKLDRMMYAGLTKKNLPRGKWRRLTSHEVVLLKHFKN